MLKRIEYGNQQLNFETDQTISTIELVEIHNFNVPPIQVPFTQDNKYILTQNWQNLILDDTYYFIRIRDAKGSATYLEMNDSLARDHQLQKLGYAQLPGSTRLIVRKNHFSGETYKLVSSDQYFGKIQESFAIYTEVIEQKNERVLFHFSQNLFDDAVIAYRDRRTNDTYGIQIDEQNYVNLLSFIQEKGRYELGLIFNNDLFHFHPITKRHEELQKELRYLNKVMLPNNQAFLPYWSADQVFTIYVANSADIENDIFNITVTVENITLIDEDELTIHGSISPISETISLLGGGLWQKDNAFVKQVEGSILDQRDDKFTLSVNLASNDIPFFYSTFFLAIQIGERVITLDLVHANKNNTRLKSMNNDFMFARYIDYSRRETIYPYLAGGKLRVAHRYLVAEENEKTPNLMDRAIKYYRLNKHRLDKKNIWLIYEKEAMRAEDNSYAFYRYMRQNHPEQEVYFVLSRFSSSWEEVTENDDHVVAFLSFRHLIYLQAAQLYVASETKGHAFPWREKRGLIKKALDKKPYVFLQHGVLGLKKIGSGMNAKSANGAKLFIVSSEREKQLVIDNLGYQENQVANTGLARWDTLVSNESLEPKTIFIMPTWRNWLEGLTDTEFVQTDYFKAYFALLNDLELASFLNDYGLTIRFFLHPKMREYQHLFTSSNQRIQIVSMEDIHVANEIAQSKLMITDYSSVAWDELYYRKPVLFYQFDRPQFDQYMGSYMNLDQDLFGEAAENISDLLAYIKRYAKNNFALSTKDLQMRDEEFVANDLSHSERIYQAILAQKLNQPKISAPLITRAIQKIIRKIRK